VLQRREPAGADADVGRRQGPERQLCHGHDRDLKLLGHLPRDRAFPFDGGEQ
jgi:hypothetical protein